ncbi:MAG: PilZ domain-containing protein [Planctomycetes bacterium]|nr:PilZ domain-containing protein [Planctomycetota bacterium]
MTKRKQIEIHEVQSADRRAAYRRKQTQAHRLSLSVRTAKGEELIGNFQDLSIGGASAKFAIHENVLSVGQTVVLTIGSLSRPGKVIAKARVLFAKESHGGRHCGFAFTEPKALASQLDSFYARFFNRRKTERVGTPLDRRIPVQLFLGGLERAADLVDLSTEGMQVRLARAAAKEFDGANHVHVRFVLPRNTKEITGRAAILRRTQLRDQVTLGLAFDLITEEGISSHIDALTDWIVHRSNEIAKWDSALTKVDSAPAPRPNADDHGGGKLGLGAARQQRPA